MQSSSKGITYMAIASLFFALMGMFVKLAKGIPTVQIVFFRGVIAMFFCIVQLQWAGVSPWGNNKKLLILRGLFGTSALFLYFYTLGQIPFATAATIQQLAPIFTTLLSVLILGERFFKFQTLFFLTSFIGIFLIKGFDSSGATHAYYTGLGSSFLAACAYTTIRKIKTSEDPLVIIFYFPLVTIPIALPFTVQQWVSPTPIQWLYLFGVGVCVQSAQYFMTRSYQLAEASFVSIASYLGVVWAVILGTFYFKESLTSYVIFGICLVLFGIVGNTVYRAFKVKQKN